MSPPKKLSTGNNRRPWIFFIALLSLLALGKFFHTQYRAQLNLITEHQIETLDIAYRATIDTFRLDVETRFRHQILQPQVLELMAEALHTPEEQMPLLRGRLYRLLFPVYAELKANGLRQFQFHLADDRALIRFHLPHMAGDSLFALRPSLRIAIQEQRPVIGLEIGRTLSGFRYVYPVSHHGQVLGSVEFSLPFENIHDLLTRTLKDGEYALLLRAEAVFSHVDAERHGKFVESILHPDFVVEDPTLSRVVRNFIASPKNQALQQLLRRNPEVQRKMQDGKSFVVPVLHDEQGYAAAFLSISDLEGTSIAYLVAITPSELVATIRNDLARNALLALFLVALLAITIWTLDDKQRALREDIARRTQAERGQRLYRNIFEHSGEAILITDHNNTIRAVNPAFTQLTGYRLEDLEGQSPGVLGSGQTPQETYQELWAALDDCGYWQGELWDRRKDGSVYPKWVSISVLRENNGEVSHYIASFTDISARKAAEEQIRHLAHHDPLTGLANRYSLESRLDQALGSARREKRPLAVLFIDMDRFKQINDTLGHAVGDLLLIEVARRLRHTVRESDIVARQGGDEFVVALTQLDDALDTTSIAEKLRHALAQTYAIAGSELHSSPSIGVAIYPGDGDNADELLRNADAAMYLAKDLGRNNVQYYTTDLNDRANERLQLENLLRKAVHEQQFVLHYQPQFDTHTGRLVAVEALVRWMHPERGLLAPAHFIALAEECGLIEELGAWVLEEACRQAAEWQHRCGRSLRVAVNLSAQQLRSPALSTLVKDCLQRHGLEENALELEITESVAMDNPARAIDQLRELNALGVGLAIDDFGTGYSSLAYLKNLPISTLKLDRSFIREIETSASDRAICSACVALAHQLGLKVVAEGVETPSQHDFLAAHGFDVVQGFLFARPEPAELILARLLDPSPPEGVLPG